MAQQAEPLESEVVGDSADVVEAVDEVVVEAGRVVRAAAVAGEVDAERAVAEAGQEGGEAAEAAAVVQPAVKEDPGMAGGVAPLQTLDTTL